MCGLGLSPICSKKNILGGKNITKTTKIVSEINFIIMGCIISNLMLELTYKTNIVILIITLLITAWSNILKQNALIYSKMM